MGRRKLDVLASSAEVANLADDAISYCLVRASPPAALCPRAE
jgi:hypothetical protein